MLLLLNFLVTTLLFTSTHVQAQIATCSPFRWNVSASASNLDLSAWSVDTLLNVPLSTLFGDGSALNFQQGVAVDVSVYGVYCEPKKDPKSTVQILVHGSSYTSDYWHGLGTAAADASHAFDYDWVYHANSRGYATIAIDRIGNGNSSRPDPKVVQYTLEVEVIHQLTKLARANIPLAEKLVYVGNAYGSILGGAIAGRHPEDFNATILTGYSNTYNTNAFGDNQIAKYVGSAATVEPARYGTVDPGYTELLTRSVHQKLFYSPPHDANPPYDSSVLNNDFKHRGTISIGEIATAYFGSLQKAENYQGHVLVATGQNDIIFCGTAPLGSASDCGNSTVGRVADTRSQFPNAKSFGAVVVPKAGSSWNNHYVAKSAFESVLDWLDENVHRH